MRKHLETDCPYATVNCSVCKAPYLRWLFIGHDCRAALIQRAKIVMSLHIKFKEALIKNRSELLALNFRICEENDHSYKVPDKKGGKRTLKECVIKRSSLCLGLTPYYKVCQEGCT